MKISRFVLTVLILAVLLFLTSSVALAAGFFLQGSGDPPAGISPEVLSAVAGVVLSLLFSYVPGLNTWYAGQSKEVKQLIMLGLLVAVAAGAYGLSCAGLMGSLFGVALTCDQAGLVSLIYAVVLAITANQATYSLTPQAGAVKEIKAEQKYETAVATLESTESGPFWEEGPPLGRE